MWLVLAYPKSHLSVIAYMKRNHCIWLVPLAEGGAKSVAGWATSLVLTCLAEEPPMIQVSLAMFGPMIVRLKVVKVGE